MGDAQVVFDNLERLSGDPPRMLAELARRLADEGQWHELFDARLMQARERLGVPPHVASLEEAPRERRAELEEAYREACREAGEGLLRAARAREAWRYLKAAGAQDRFRAALESFEINDENADELIELALHEGAFPELGLRWLLERYGTCNAITTLDGLGPGLPPEDLTPCARVLVDWLAAELAESLSRHVESVEGARPRETDLASLMRGRDWLFEQQAAHVDASHLAATVRWARVLDDPDTLQKAVQLAQYGERLDESLQYADAPPFEATYPSHRLYFQALVGERVDEAVAAFRRHAEQRHDEPDGPACVEAYLRLLERTGRAGEALAEYARLTHDHTPLSPWAPSPLRLAERSGDWDAYDAVMRRRGDAVGFAAGLLARPGR